MGLNDFATLAVAMLALIGVVYTAVISRKNNDKSIFVQSVTNERAKWRSEMRSEVSEFLAIAMQLSFCESTEKKELLPKEALKKSLPSRIRL